MTLWSKRGDPIGEVWLTGDECLIATGKHAGEKLGNIFDQMPEALLGDGISSTASPLLIKVLFAKEKLSVQVHPDDAMAQKYGDPRGKTECWYALAAEPGAVVALGFKPGVTLAQVKDEIVAGTLEASLKLVPVTAGEVIFVDAGTVHSIWPGSILLETQQNCDLTYRMFDYGRGARTAYRKSAGSYEARDPRGDDSAESAQGSHDFDRRGILSRGADSGCGEPVERQFAG